MYCILVVDLDECYLADTIFEMKRDIQDLNRSESFVRIKYYERSNKPVYIIVYDKTAPIKSKKPFKLKYDIKNIFYVDDLINELPPTLKEEFLLRKKELDKSLLVY